MLIDRLDPDETVAAEKYELLRQKLIKCLAWKGCPEIQADALADLVLDRVSAKLGQGENIKNVNAYAYEVMKFVWLEHCRRHKEFTVGDDMPDVAVHPNTEIFDEPDLRMRCLRKCLAEVVPEERDRRLIIGYYDAEPGEKNKDKRKNLAKELDLSMVSLKVKACKLRVRLEQCINDCVQRISSGYGESVRNV
jgi:DNA-directed RNA polymerase specialized sigma24 family protein